MATLIRESMPIAKKPYRCMASDWLVNSDIDPGYLTFAELRSIVRAKRNGWRVMPGEKYLSQVVVCCGDFGVFKAIPAIDKICHRLDIYEDVC